MSEKLLTVKQVAERLGIKTGTVYNLVSRKQMPAIKVFGALRFDPEDIERLIERGRINSPIGEQTHAQKQGG